MTITNEYLYRHATLKMFSDATIEKMIIDVKAARADYQGQAVQDFLSLGLPIDHDKITEYNRIELSLQIELGRRQLNS